MPRESFLPLHLWLKTLKFEGRNNKQSYWHSVSWLNSLCAVISNLIYKFKKKKRESSTSHLVLLSRSRKQNESEYKQRKFKVALKKKKKLKEK